MDEKEVLLEAWKQTVNTQMEFNTIAMNIRGFALTLVAALVTAEGITGGKAGWLILVALLIVWAAFYLMDRWWYHYLLLGAVVHGKDLETRAKELKLTLPGERSLLGLSHRISELNEEALNLKAKYKIDIFYGLIFIALVIFVLVRLLSNGTM